MLVANASLVGCSRGLKPKCDILKCEEIQQQRQASPKGTHLRLEAPDDLQGWTSLLACAAGEGEGKGSKGNNAPPDLNQ